MNRETAISKLCPKCGLCCNGVLFADVKLRKGDDARRLAGLGLPVEPAGRRPAFAQPCACFDGQFCRIYAGRPQRCRTFECGLLKKVEAGQMTVRTALKKISTAKRLVQKARRLFGQLDDRNEHLPLVKRYVQIMAGAIDLSKGGSPARLRGQLLQAMDELMRMLHENFRQ